MTRLPAFSDQDVLVHIPVDAEGTEVGHLALYCRSNNVREQVCILSAYIKSPLCSIFIARWCMACLTLTGVSCIAAYSLL